MLTRLAVLSVSLMLATSCQRESAEVAQLPALSENAPKDQMVQGDARALEQAIAPYVEQGRKTWPQAKQRFVAGLPPGHNMFVMTKLRHLGDEEVIFVAVSAIKEATIVGRIASEIQAIPGYKAGDIYELPEAELKDWMISRPDGSEEGNVVGKFLDEYGKHAH